MKKKNLKQRKREIKLVNNIFKVYFEQFEKKRHHQVEQEKKKLLYQRMYKDREQNGSNEHLGEVHERDTQGGIKEEMR